MVSMNRVEQSISRAQYQSDIGTSLIDTYRILPLQTLWTFICISHPSYQVDINGT
jgi:hypothetical protein